MCFSATASFIAGAATSGVGVLTLKSVKSRREIPLAVIPFLFGIQQFIEGVLWLSFNLPTLNLVLTYIYLFYSHIWWPFFIPLSVYLVEKNKIRKKILQYLIILGICVGVYFILYTLTGSVSSSIVDNSILYSCKYYNIDIVLGLYMLTTCISCFISSHKMIKIFGLAVFISAFITYEFYITTFTSVWCFFAAILSLILLFHFKMNLKVRK